MEGAILDALYAYGSCRKSKELKVRFLLEKLLSGEEPELFEDYLKELKKRLMELKPYPFCELIASRNGISDPFSEKVVRAYWTGNDLLKKFPARENPHHNFCLLRDAKICSRDFGWKLIVANINLCRISWGRVMGSLDSEMKFVVESGLLKCDSKGFFETNPRELKVKGGLVQDIKKGDIISLHWLEAREIITDEKKMELDAVNRQLVEMLNNPGGKTGLPFSLK